MAEGTRFAEDVAVLVLELPDGHVGNASIAARTAVELTFSVLKVLTPRHMTQVPIRLFDLASTLASSICGLGMIRMRSFSRGPDAADSRFYIPAQLPNL